MFGEFQLLLQRLADAEYLHLVLEGLPLYGGAFSLIGLALAALLRQRRMQFVLMILMAVSFGAAVPAQELRRQALPRVLATHDAAHRSLIEEQTDRRGDLQWLFLVIALLAVAALVLSRMPKLGPGLQMMLLPAAAIGVMIALWLHMKEAEIHHRNIVKPQPFAASSLAPAADADAEMAGVQTTAIGSMSIVRITSLGAWNFSSTPLR